VASTLFALLFTDGVLRGFPGSPHDAVSQPQTIAVVVGTRPEAIKMGPLVLALRREPRFRPVLVSTAQHTDMLDQALDAFGLEPDIDLGLTRIGSSIESFLGSALEPLGKVFAKL